MIEPIFGLICPVEDGVIDRAVGRELLPGGGRFSPTCPFFTNLFVIRFSPTRHLPRFYHLLRRNFLLLEKLVGGGEGGKTE